MHYDTDQMTRVLTLVVAVILADGQVSPEERELFELMVENLGLEEAKVHPFRQALAGDSSFDLEQGVVKAANGVGWNEAAEMVRNAYVVAHVDQSVDVAEARVIDPFLRAAGLDEKQLPAAHAWGRMAAQHMVLAEAVFG